MMNTSGLLQAQRKRDIFSEARLLKEIADQLSPIKRVNAASVLPMPDRLMTKVVFGASDCWNWRGHVDALGYGRMPYAGENKAHRVSYAYFTGPIAPGLLVLHRCDNRQCVNPAHLFLGTQSDNMKDMVAKGRQGNVGRSGERNSGAKLTAQQVHEIRGMVAAGAAQAEASRKFGVSPMTVSRIIRKESWT